MHSRNDRRFRASSYFGQYLLALLAIQVQWQVLHAELCPVLRIPGCKLGHWKPGFYRRLSRSFKEFDLRQLPLVSNVLLRCALTLLISTEKFACRQDLGQNFY